MIIDIDEEIEKVVKREGGYVDHPSDKGGPTKYGITRAKARQNGYTGSMRELPIELARTIYKRRYWLDPNIDKVANVAPQVAAELFDTAVNMGPSVQIAYLQRWLNAFNRQQKDFDDICVTAVIDGKTLLALHKYIQRRDDEGEIVLARAINCSQGHRYLELSEARAKNEDFTYGWLRNRVLI